MPTPAEIAAALVAREEMPPEKGDVGPQGLTGPQGDTGPEGPEGPQGPEGIQGPEGQQGIQGPKGDLGSRGPKGDKGDKGDPGRDGAPGANGRGYNVRGLASGMVIDNQGTAINQGKVVGEVDFSGAGVSTAITGGRAVVTIPGGGGGGGLTLTQSDIDPGAVGAGNFWLEALFGNGADDGGYGRLWVRNSTDTGWNSGGPTTFANSGANLITSPSDNAELLLADSGGSYLTDPTSVKIQGSNRALFFASTGVHLGTNAAAVALLTGSADPSAGGGVAAPVGSAYFRTNGTLWQKTGAGDTAWTVSGVALSNATPAVDTGAGAAGTGSAASRDDHNHPTTLASVLAAGADPDGRAIIGALVDGGQGGRMVVQPAPGGGAGGVGELQGGNGTSGQAGGYANINGGDGDGGTKIGAFIGVSGGSATDHGYVGIRTDNSFGTTGQFLGSDGNSQVEWRAAPTLAEVVASGSDANGYQINNVYDPTSPQDAATKAYVDSRTAASVADIPDPSSATAEDVANKINELMASLRTAGLLAA